MTTDNHAALFAAFMHGFFAHAGLLSKARFIARDANSPATAPSLYEAGDEITFAPTPMELRVGLAVHAISEIEAWRMCGFLVAVEVEEWCVVRWSQRVGDVNDVKQKMRLVFMLDRDALAVRPVDDEADLYDVSLVVAAAVDEPSTSSQAA